VQDPRLRRRASGRVDMTNAEPDAKTGNDRCWGAILRGDTEGKHCAPDFQMGKHHFKTKFCRTCSEEGILVTADRCRIVQTSAPAENGTTLGFWKIAPNHRGARYRLINQTAKCTKPPYLVLENASSAIASAAFLRPMPASFIDTQGCVLLHVLNGTLVPFAASDRLFISRPGRSRKRAAEEAAPPAVPGLDLQQHSMLQLYHQQHQQEGQMARAMLLTLQQQQRQEQEQIAAMQTGEEMLAELLAATDEPMGSGGAAPAPALTPLMKLQAMQPSFSPAEQKQQIVSAAVEEWGDHFVCGLLRGLFATCHTTASTSWPGWPMQDGLYWVIRYLTKLATIHDSNFLFERTVRTATACGVSFADATAGLEAEMAAGPNVVVEETVLRAAMSDKEGGTGFALVQGFNLSRNGDFYLRASPRFERCILDTDTLLEQCRAPDGGGRKSLYDPFVHPNDADVLPMAIGKILAGVLTFKPDTRAAHATTALLRVRMRSDVRSDVASEATDAKGGGSFRGQGGEDGESSGSEGTGGEGGGMAGAPGNAASSFAAPSDEAPDTGRSQALGAARQHVLDTSYVPCKVYIKMGFIDSQCFFSNVFEPIAPLPETPPPIEGASGTEGSFAAASSSAAAGALSTAFFVHDHAAPLPLPPLELDVAGVNGPFTSQGARYVPSKPLPRYPPLDLEHVGVVGGSSTVGGKAYVNTQVPITVMECKYQKLLAEAVALAEWDPLGAADEDVGR